MVSSVSSPLRLELMTVGEKDNDWGTITNENLQMLEGATTSYLEITSPSTSQAPTVTDYALTDYHNLVYKFTGSPGGAVTYTVPAYERPYIIHNSCGYTVTIKVSGQTGVDVATGTKAYVYCDGTDVRELVNNPASVTATQTLTNKTLTAPKFADGGFIADANGNELIVMDTVTSAVNEVTVSNAASPAVTATITIAVPAVVTVAATPPSGTPVVFTTTGALPTGLVANTIYFVKYINATTFNVAATTNGTSITTTGSQSGTHTATFTGVPIIAASGDGTNVSVNIASKGSGIVQANGVEVVTLTGTQTLTNKTLTSPTVSGATITTATITSPTITSPTITGAALSAGTITVAPVNFTSGTNLTTAIAGAVEYDGRVFYGTPQGTQRGVIPGMQFYKLDGAVTGANSTAVQNMLGVGVTLSSSTVYAFEALYYLTKTAGTTSHTMGFGFGGTATLNKILYLANGFDSSTAINARVGSSAIDLVLINQAANTTITGASTSASQSVLSILKGTVSIDVGGTFIPQYTLSAAPGGVYSTIAGSYFLIYPISQSGSNTSVGTWAV